MSTSSRDTIHIRQANALDLPEVARLAASLVRLHHSLDASRFLLEEPVEDGYAWFFGKEIARKESVIFVAERRPNETDEPDETTNPAIVGYAWGRLEPRDWMELRDACGRLHEVYVDPSIRRSGIGRRLLQETLSWLEANGAPRIVLTSAWQNASAHRFFESLGFRPTMIEMTRDREP